MEFQYVQLMSNAEKIADSARRLATWIAKSGTERVNRANCSQLLGALFAFRRAEELGSNGIDAPPDVDELGRVAKSLASNDVDIAEKRWLAGFYFNSGKHRVRGVAEALGLKRSADPRWIALREDDNRFKHRTKYNGDERRPRNGHLVPDIGVALELVELLLTKIGA